MESFSRSWGPYKVSLSNAISYLGDYGAKPLDEPSIKSGKSVKATNFSQCSRFRLLKNGFNLVRVCRNTLGGYNKSKEGDTICKESTLLQIGIQLFFQKGVTDHPEMFSVGFFILTEYKDIIEIDDQKFIHIGL